MVAQDPSPFPFLSAGRFVQGCEDLVALFERTTRAQCDWRRVELPPEHDGLTWLRIIRDLTHESVQTRNACGEYFDPEESDEEALSHDHGPAPTPYVEYSILLSPIYRVPVLYFSLHGLPADSDASVDRVQDLIVPPQFSAQVRSVGVMGGISMANHPVTDISVFFVHPCNTVAALAESASESEPSPLQYMLQWFGVIGACVGLQIPMDFALQANRAS